MSVLLVDDLEPTPVGLHARMCPWAHPRSRPLPGSHVARLRGSRLGTAPLGPRTPSVTHPYRDKLLAAATARSGKVVSF